MASGLPQRQWKLPHARFRRGHARGVQRAACVYMQARGGDDLGLGRPRSSLSARSVTPKLDASLGAAAGRAEGAADETSRAQRAVELLEKKQAAPQRASARWLWTRR